MFLDEAIWRRKYKHFSDRINFLSQLNVHQNYSGFQPDQGFAFIGDEQDHGNISDPEDVDYNPIPTREVPV